MKLRFAVDQAEAFRKGIDCPNSIITVEVRPDALDQTTRDAIADRMNTENVILDSLTGGIDVYHGNERDATGRRRLIVAKTPTFEGLIQAIEEDKLLTPCAPTQNT